MHWWNRIERHNGRLYDLISPPGVDTVSPLASLALSMSLQNRTRSGIPNAWCAPLPNPRTCIVERVLLSRRHGHNQTLPPVCEQLNCTIGDPVLVYEYDIRKHPFRVSVRNDFAFAVWLLSAMLEPAVNLLSQVSLRCVLAPEDFCPMEMRGQGDVVRTLEDEIGGGEGSSSDLPLCLSDVACLDAAAQRAAARLGAARALPPADALFAVAAANGRLFEGYRSNVLQGLMFNDTLKETHRLAKEHQEVVDKAVVVPSQGRRMEEIDQQYYKAHTLVNTMRLLSGIVCEKLNASDYGQALEARLNATRHWSLLEGGGNSMKDVQNAWCWDCELHRPLACTTFFSMAGRRLSLLRDRLDGPTKEQRREAIEKHVREKAKDLCCARFKDGTEKCGPEWCPFVARDQFAKRMGHVTRKLHQTKHPSARKLGVDSRVAADAVHREDHPHAECRAHNRSLLGITDAECFAKSLVHHLGDKHGLSPTAVTEKAKEFGFDIGNGMMSMMRFFGATGEKRQSGEKRDTPRNKANAEALKLLSSPQQPGRRMQERRKPRTKHVPSTTNFSETIKGLQQIEHAAARRRRMHAQEVGRAPPRSVPVAKPGSLWASVKKAASVMAPDLAISSIVGTEGSLLSRFAPGIDAVSKATDKHKKQLERLASRRRLEREERGRRMEEARARAPHRHEDVIEMLESRRRERAPRRVLVEIPESHTLSWVHEVIDFKETYETMKRMAEVERKRSELRAQGLDHAYIADRHPHDHHRLDHPGYRPSILGDALRRLHSRITIGKDPDWHKHPRQERQGIRRLADGFVRGTLAAPFAFRDTPLLDGTVFTRSEENIFAAAIRYVVFGTIGCYLLNPDRNPSNTLGQTFNADSESVSDLPDGDPSRIVRPSEEKLCFPAIPVVFGRWPSFRSLTGTFGVDYKSLSYESYCAHDGAAQHVADAMEDVGLVTNASNKEFVGQAAPLRVGEGIDAINNAVKAAQATTPLDRAGHLLCTVTEFSGILYSLLLLFGLIIFLLFLSCFNCLARFGYALTCFTVSNAAGANLDDEAGGEAKVPVAAKPVVKVAPVEPVVPVLPVTTPPVLNRQKASDTPSVRENGFLSTVFGRVIGKDQSSSDEEERLL